MGFVPLSCNLHAYQLAIDLFPISNLGALRPPTFGFSALSRFEDERYNSILLSVHALLHDVGPHFSMGTYALDSSISRRAKSVDTALRCEELLLLCKSDSRLEAQG